MVGGHAEGCAGGDGVGGVVDNGFFVAARETLGYAVGEAEGCGVSGEVELTS